MRRVKLHIHEDEKVAILGASGFDAGRWLSRQPWKGRTENQSQNIRDGCAKEAQFFSFGTNDLTQTTFGFSRDDINKVLPTYLAEGILKQDPFAVLDREDVGQLVKMATERGRKTRSNLKVGICGEHGGEPSSVEFCYQTGLNYVSCSPFCVLTARLAAAQAAASDKLKVKGGRTK